VTDPRGIVAFRCTSACASTCMMLPTPHKAEAHVGPQFTAAGGLRLRSTRAGLSLPFNAFSMNYRSGRMHRETQRGATGR
jgi:hypothetical protein